MYKALAAIKYVAIEGAGRRRRSNPAAGASHTHLSHCPPIMLRGTRPQFVSIQPRQREFTMDFVQAIKSCLGQYATFSGRASRSEYWWFFLFQVLVMVATGMLGDVINGLASLALLLPALAVGTRRLHDIGHGVVAAAFVDRDWFLCLAVLVGATYRRCVQHLRRTPCRMT